ncbi:cytochrome P450 89A2 [Cinnamomum micranthum f. kanehirae]|uniref:Cytochrome P450 89A2 n=1 Tax=Cinnamomum micranthum f. kanehirae TaxID=337451 RepID=A0A443PAM8_9MAGN|nr:cytochrome P450 89A2 [Cinnamomum micranthum f. kanehirae]
MYTTVGTIKFNTPKTMKPTDLNGKQSQTQNNINSRKQLPNSMDSLSIILISLSLCVATALVSTLFTTAYKKRKLPPGPPLLSNFQWLTKSIFDLEPILRQLRSKYGPIFTIRRGPRTHIYISDHSLAHKALVEKGSVFSDRPPVSEASRILTSNQHNINTAGYGPLWRLFRRNLMSEILHPSKVKTFAQGREWVLKLLIEDLRRHADSGEPVFVAESFQYAMFCLLLFMCFGQKLDESTVKKIKDIQRRLLARSPIFDVLHLFPKIGKILFRGRWNALMEIRREREELLLPLIRARKVRNQDRQDDNTFLFSYVDSLLDLELQEEGGRKLTEGEIVSLCSEFLNAGTDTTSTSLQWIMANLVKDPEIQQKLLYEIERVVGKEAEIVREEDLNAMPYLKAVIMEGLRRHPPGHFVLPHAVSEEVTFEGYVIPKDATINFLVAEMGWDEKVWKEAMAFKPERFLDSGEKVDITGSREIKMMPFGVGRRICPGLNLAMLHLEYFVANLVKEFEWKTVEGEEVDLTEKQEFTIVMKKPLKAKITARTM